MKEKRKHRINGCTKGKEGERELVQLFRDVGLTARRSEQYCGNTGDAADVICEELPGLHIESKRVEKLNLYSAMDQAVRDAAKFKKLPVVFHRKNRREWVAILDAKKLLKIFKKLKGIP